jgi:hypothetical protein
LLLLFVLLLHHNELIITPDEKDESSRQGPGCQGIMDAGSTRSGAWLQ